MLRYIRHDGKHEFEVDETYVHNLLSFSLGAWIGTPNRSGQNYYLNTRLLVADKGYLWNSWVSHSQAIESFLIRDVLYTAMRDNYVPKSYRRLVDREFRIHLKNAGVPFKKRWILWAVSRLYGECDL